MTQSATILQVVSTFDAGPMRPALLKHLAGSGIAEFGFTSREEMTSYMVAPSSNTELVAGTVVIVRVEDWLRAGMNPSPGNSLDSLARKELQARVRDFVNEISVLALRGQPVWFLACPSSGWFAEQNKFSALCRTYTNLLAARVRNVPGVNTLNWPAVLTGVESDDRRADEANNIPLTQEAFDRLAEFVSAQVTRTLSHADAVATHSGSAGSPELAAYLAGLCVEVEVRPASERDRTSVDRIIRTAASFSLTGERSDISDAEIAAMVESGSCLLVNVCDRMDNHGPSGVVSYRRNHGAFEIEAMSLSCTVLGKQVEYALLSALAQLAGKSSCSTILFKYKPSGRNQTMLAFLKAVADPDEGTAFSLPIDMAQNKIAAQAVNPAGWTLRLMESKQDSASV